MEVNFNPNWISISFINVIWAINPFVPWASSAESRCTKCRQPVVRQRLTKSQIPRACHPPPASRGQGCVQLLQSRKGRVVPQLDDLWPGRGQRALICARFLLGRRRRRLPSGWPWCSLDHLFITSNNKKNAWLLSSVYTHSRESVCTYVRRIYFFHSLALPMVAVWSPHTRLLSCSNLEIIILVRTM